MDKSHNCMADVSFLCNYITWVEIQYFERKEILMGGKGQLE